MAGPALSAKRPRRQPDLALREPVAPLNRPLSVDEYRKSVPSAASIVVDFGSSALRAGFSSDDGAAPRLHFPPYVARSREAGAHGMHAPVGYEALATSHRSAARSPFDGSVPNNATLVERLLDGMLIRLGLAGEDEIRHPMVLTEPPCQPNGVRAQFTELLFETYRVPKICFGVDALFSYLLNGSAPDGRGGVGYARKSGVVVSCGFHTTHVLPVHEGSYYAPGTKRINLGGHNMTTNLSRRLQLRNPDYATLFSYSRVEALKHDTCYVSEAYDAELAAILDDVATFDRTTKLVKLPAADGSGEKLGLTAEDQDRAKQLRIERGRRLSEMMKERSRAKAAAAAGGVDKRAKDAEPAVTVTAEESAPLLAARTALRELEMIREAREKDEDLYFLALVAAGFETEEAFDEAAVERGGAVVEARAELGEEKAALVDLTWQKRAAEDELMNVPDADLSATGLKRKRKLAMLRGAAEARLRIKREKEAAAGRERAAQEASARAREEDPEKYLENLRRERAEVAERAKRRASAKDAGSDRRSLAARQRMRLLAQHAGADGAVEEAGGGGPKAGGRRRGPAPKGKNADDTFGMQDSDWDVYRDMRLRDDVGEEESDNDSEVDRATLARLRAEILSIAPDDDDPTLVRPVGSALLYVPHGFADEVPVTIERLATPEVLFQPSLHGVEQCGLIEAIELVVNGPAFADPTARRAIVNEVFLTGGVANVPGLEARIARELRSRFPTAWGDGIAGGVRRAGDPTLDAWRGARLFADAGGSAFRRACISRRDYEEVGPDYMGEHGMANMHVPTPSMEPVEAEQRKKPLRRSCS
jgi:actin-related protein 5